MRFCGSNNLKNASCREGLRQRTAGFTMVEIAISIGVVAFALVAILGVLPTGMTVQKDNREETIINQEGRYWIDLIRSGAHGAEDITNYVESITVTNLTKPGKSMTFESSAGLFRPEEVMALFSIPKIDYENDEVYQVLARVKAMTGSAVEKGSLTNDTSFRYQMQVEMLESWPFPSSLVNNEDDPVRQAQLSAYLGSMRQKLHEIRLTLRWPVVERGKGWHVGGNRKIFRARVAGTFVPLNSTNVSSRVAQYAKSQMKRNSLYILEPNNFDAQLAVQP